MQISANESVSGTVIHELRERGHDVLFAKEFMRSVANPTILARAQAERRVVLTHDKDFGELAFQSRLPQCGVIFLRLMESVLRYCGNSGRTYKSALIRKWPADRFQMRLTASSVTAAVR